MDTALRSHQVVYNRFHLISESHQTEQQCTISQLTTYNEVEGTDFWGQPANLQVPNTLETRYSNAEGLSRSELRVQSSDNYGNILETTESSGIITRNEYYPVEGEEGRCPPEPCGVFVSYLKRTTIESSDETSEESLSTDYEYAALPTEHDAPFHNQTLVQPSRLQSSAGLELQIQYHSTPETVPLHGLPEYMTRSQPANEGERKETSLRWAYTLTDETLARTATLTGFDGLTRQQTETLARYSQQVMSQVDGQGVSRRYQRDDLGRLIEVIDAADSAYERRLTVGYVTTQMPAMKVVTDAWGVQTQIHYDGFQREVAVQRQDVDEELYEVQSTHYDEQGRPSVEVLSDYLEGTLLINQTQSYRYDGWGEVCERHTEGLGTEFTEHDKVNRTVTQGRRDEAGETIDVTRTVMNEFEAPERIETLNDGEVYQSVSIAYTPMGKASSVTSPEGEQLRIASRDTFDRPQEIQHFDGSVYTFTHSDLNVSSDSLWQLAIDGLSMGLRTVDGLERVIEVSQFGSTHQREYDTTSGPIPSAIQNGCGQRIQINSIPELQAIEQLFSEHHSAPILTRDYADTNATEAPGTLMHSSGTGGETYYAYYPDGHLATETHIVDEDERDGQLFTTLNGLVHEHHWASRVATWQYNALGQISAMEDGGHRCVYHYDAFGRVIQISIDESGEAVSETYIEYDAHSREVMRRIETKEGEWRQSGQYDVMNRLIERTTLLPASQGQLDEQFEYDAMGRLVAYHVLPSSSSSLWPVNEYHRAFVGQYYTYSAQYNLLSLRTQFDNGDEDVATWEYDPQTQKAVRITHSLTEGENAYPAVITLGYDEDGNLTLVEEEGVAVMNATYTELNQLASLNGVDYRYDGQHQAVKVGEATRYYRQGQWIEESTPDSETHFMAGLDGVTAVEKAGESTRLMKDARGSAVMAQSDEDETRYFNYAPFGTADHGNVRVGFNGEVSEHHWDGYLLGQGVRLYTPAFPRFGVRDPLALFGGGGINAYAYCSGDPINFADPSGYMDIGAIFGNVVGIIGAAVGIALAIPTGGASLTVAAAAAIALGTAEISASAVSIGLEIAGNEEGADIAGYVAGGLGIASGLAGGGGSNVARKADGLGGNWMISHRGQPSEDFGLSPSVKSDKKILSKLPADVKNHGGSIYKVKNVGFDYFIDYPKNIKGKRLNIIGHSTNYSNNIFWMADEADSVDNLFELIKQSSIKFDSIRYIACFTGMNGIAERTVKAFNVPVKAHMDEIITFDKPLGSSWLTRHSHNDTQKLSLISISKDQKSFWKWFGI
ncbi:RHS repeat domain-containing protein [Vibrio paucivorans]